MGFLRRILGQSDVNEESDKTIRDTARPTTTSAQPTSGMGQTEELSRSENLQQADTIKTKPTEAPPTPLSESLADVALNPDGATRQLAPEKARTGKGHLTFGLTSDVGRLRANNQDTAYSFFSSSHSADNRPDFGLFIVADGMGGHVDGEKASALAASTAATYILQSLYLPLLNGTNDSDSEPINDAMISAAQKANDQVLRHVKDGGTTLTCVLIIGELAHIVHVGDSRVYLVSEDGIEQLTRDHSLVQRLVELDQVAPDEAANHSHAGILYRAIGQSDTLEVDTLTRRLAPNARLVLCSDGLWGEVTSQEIHTLASDTNNPQDACDKLIMLANSHGGKDNITAIIVKMPK